MAVEKEARSRDLQELISVSSEALQGVVLAPLPGVARGVEAGSAEGSDEEMRLLFLIRCP